MVKAIAEARQGLFLTILLTACSPGASTGPEANALGGSTGQGSASAGPGGDSSNSGRASTGALPPICDQMSLQSQTVPPNILLVVDRSTSMHQETSQAPNAPSKVDAAKIALRQLLQNGAGKIRFGWMEYPADTFCSPGTVSVECADDSSAAISGKIDALFPGGFTPIASSLNNALQYQGLHDSARSNFVILLTDGAPNCDLDPESNSVKAVEALRAASIGTFVIGLGEELNSSEPAALNRMAEAGGHARQDATKYFSANTLQELEAVFQSIGGMVMSCVISLNPPPENPALILVSLDGQAVARDPSHQNGFDYDRSNNQMQLYGAVCDKLRSGQVGKLEVKMGCAPPD